MSRPKKRPNACPIGRGCMHCHIGSELGNGKDKLPPCDRRKVQDDGEPSELEWYCDECGTYGRCPSARPK